VCFTTLYILDDIMIVFTMAFKWVLKILKTCVNFTGLQEENYFCSRKIFTSRKLTGVETLLPVSIIFQLNENTNRCIANSGQSDCISHPNTHTQTQKRIIYIYIFGNNYFNSWGIFRLHYLKFAGGKLRTESLLSNYQIARFHISDDGNDSSYHYELPLLNIRRHVLITGNISFLSSGNLEL